MSSPLSANTPRSKEMVKIFRRNNGKLYLEYEAYGKRVQKSTRRMDTKTNRDFIKKEVIPELEKKILNGDFNKEKPQKFSYYAERFLKKKRTKKTYKKMVQYVSVLNETFGDVSIDRIKVTHIDDWVEERSKENSSKTIRNYLSAMSGTMKEGMKAEVISKNVALGIELPESHKEVADVEPFSDAEVSELLKNVDGSLKLFIAIGFMTGLRTGEILALRKEDIDLDNQTLYVKRAIADGLLRTPKTNKSIREVPIFDGLVPYLKGIKKDGFLFAKRNGSHYAAFPGHYKRAWKKLLNETCNIKYRKIYATRHTFIVNMIATGKLSILKIAQMVGHTTIKMIVQHYAKFIKGEHMDIDRSINIFATDKVADSVA